MMKRQFVYRAIMLCFIAGLIGFVQGQDQKAIAEAQKWFNLKSYDKALAIFQQSATASTNPLVNYQIGICLMKAMPPKPLAAIPYFEKAIPAKAPVPTTVHFELAQLYARNEDLGKAIEQAKIYSELTKVDKKAQAEVNQFLEACARAKAYMTVPRNFTVQPFPGNVNTEYTEYNPVVSADESVMAFTALRPKDDKVYSAIKQVEE
jgi:tetratricopeptide (TPR) repeat protein